MKHILTVLCLLSFINGGFLVAQTNPFQAKNVLEKKDGELRVICFGAHPDDAEIKAGGSAILWNKLGHKVALVSTTNGDVGHWREAGGPLAKRRYDEAQKAAEILGTKTIVWDIHDGELEPTLENRKKFIRAVRNWRADLVIAHRPNDYHPDHRYTGILMQDAAYMVNVPHICPDVEPLEKMPVFLYSYDSFKNPPFRVDVAVAIDYVIEKKLDAIMIMESQFVEGGALGKMDPRTASTDPKVVDEIRKTARDRYRQRFAAWADASRDKLKELYGEEAGSKVKYAEPFEMCEYGRPGGKALTPEEIKFSFPFINKK
ncbi:MAG: PIG-L family deacetylase [Planctomycetaceae bacterium]|nr:PIG-L family deacetylase [Planctomycetaceae bacterium]